MTVDEILAEVEGLPTEEKMQLVEALGSRACCAVMGDLWEAHRMMRSCMSALPPEKRAILMRRWMDGRTAKEARHA